MAQSLAVRNFRLDHERASNGVIIKRIFINLIKILGVLFVAVCILAGIILYPLYKPMPAPNFPKPQNAAEANRQDLEYLRQLAKMDRSFTAETRAAFHRVIDQLLAQAATLDRAALEMEVAKAVAIADNGHTNARGISFGRHLNAIPLRFAWFQEGLFVIKSDRAHTDLIGAQVLTIGGNAPADLALTLRPYVGGNAPFAHEFTPYFFASPPALHAINLLPSPSEVALTLQLGDGSKLERVVATGTQPAIGTNETRLPRYDLSPVTQPADGQAWVHVLDDLPTLPPFLQHTDRKYWRADLSNPALLYVQINSVTDQAGDVPLTTFLNETLAHVAQQQPRDIVVDLRFNPGGNYERTVTFTQKLPELVPANGKIFILTSGNTFSAAIVTLARLKYFAGARAEIVGEPIGDREQQWGEGGAFSLPNSQIVIHYATGYHDWEHGCALREFRTCFFLNYLFGVPAGKLSPTIPAPTLFSDYIAGQDSVLNTVKQVIVAADQ